MSAALDFTYQYTHSSGILATNGGKLNLALATCNTDLSHPYFFDGRIRSPRIMGDMLITLSDVVRTHFFLKRPVLLDPVLTSNENVLRLEGFSGCCGVYARVDLPADFFEGHCHGRGTTNVDFNTPMRNALIRLRDNEDVQFSVGKEEVVLSKGNEKTVEKKVKLPLRWIKGFSEIQAYQPRLQLRMEISAPEALKFIRTLPAASKPKMPSFIVSSGKSARLSQRPQPGSVQIAGTHRVKIIEPLLARAHKLRIWSDNTDGTSAWEVCFAQGTFFLMISPEVYRGFSGEGQLLSSLAKPPAENIVALVRAQLKWQSEIDAKALSRALQVGTEEIDGALAVLGSRGLAGFDAAHGRYFHRELPFDLSKVEALQPRLINARKLVEAGGIRRLDENTESLIYLVPGTDTTHRVQLETSEDRCTCPWFSKYQGARGPCKHILAAQLVDEASERENV